MKLRPIVRAQREQGIALVLVLIVLSLLLITVVTFLTSTSIERGTARAYSYAYQAKLAADSGLAAAGLALTQKAGGAAPITQNDEFIVVRSDSADGRPYFSIGLVQPSAPNSSDSPPSARKVDYVPLVSGAILQKDIAGDQVPIVTTFLPSSDAEVKTFPWMDTAKAKWITVEAPPTTQVGAAPTRLRYAYWVEDMGAYLDAGFDPNAATADAAGNVDGTGSVHKRPFDVASVESRYKTSPKELALFTLFSPNAFPDPGGTAAKPIIESRPLLFTPYTAGQLAQRLEASRFVGANFFYEDEPVIIPRGFGYKNESKPAFAINAALTSTPANVAAIAQVITDNLPKFASVRQGGLTSLDYNKTIAASIIDYADTDSDATIGPDYRGLDSHPFVSEIYNSKLWRDTRLAGSYQVDIRMDTWVEVWNMSNKPANGTMEISITESHPVTVGFTSYTFGEPVGPIRTTSYPSNPQSIPVNLGPNEYKIFHIQRDDYVFDSGVSPPLIFPPAGVTALSLSASASSKYELKWKDAGAAVVVDRATNGIQRIAKSLRRGSGTAEQRWSGSIPGFAYVAAGSTNGGGPFFNNQGDPRLAYYSAGTQAANTWINASLFPPGRNLRNNISAGTISGLAPGEADYREVRPSSWFDGGHDSAVGAAPADETKTPTNLASNSAEGTKAPMYLANRGSLVNVAELGNIYDPASWQVKVDGARRWTDIANGSTATPNGNYGGGMTLRIGRPEFQRFDVPGSRAVQLLDLFTLNAKVSTRAKVNLNTASKDVLRALGGGLLLNRDPDLKPAALAGTLTVPSASQHADVFADAVIAARPFLSPSQLGRLRVFGDVSSYPTASRPTEWNDSGTEEYFAKVFPLSTARSRNFRVFVSGQVIDKNNRVISTANRVYQIQLRPNRDSNGVITSQNIRTVYEGTL